MAHSPLEDAHRSAEAQDRYNRGLANALHGQHWIHDPSYELGQDPLVYAKVSRDPVVAHAIRFRKLLAAGREWRIEPASEESPADAKAAEIVKALLDKIFGFTDARIRLGDSIFRGSSYEFIEGARGFERIAGIPGQWWVPRRLKNVSRLRFRLVRERGRISWEFWSAERQDWEPLEHPEWFCRATFDDTEESLGYGQGLLGTLYRFQALKSQSMQRMGRACERFSNGFAVFKVANADQPAKPRGGPSRGAQTRATAALQSYAKHRTDDAIAIDKEDEFTFVNGIGEGWAILTDAIGYLDTNMVMAVLGSTLATMQSLGEVGSNAKAKEHATSTESLSQADRDGLAEVLTRDLVGAVWRQNRWQIQDLAPGAAMPSLKIGQQKQDDPTVASTVVATLLGAGVPLLSSEVYSKTGFTIPGEDEAVIEPVAIPAGADPANPLAGLGL